MQNSKLNLELEVVSANKKQKVGAWSVHTFTMTGIVWASLAILALWNGQIRLMWLWLSIALIVDGVDGFFARKLRVKEVLPGFDGSILDMVVDYLTWTFIPALFMYFYIPFAPDYNNQWLPLLMFIIIGVSSVFCYCNTNMKASDYYFVGFPAAWNIVAVYMYLFKLHWVTNIVITIILSLLTITKLKFVHPFRVKKFMLLNIIATCMWIISVGCLVAEITILYNLAYWGLIISSVWFFINCAWRSIQDYTSN